MSWALFLQAIELVLCGNHIYDVFFASTNFLFLIMGELTWNFYSWLNKLLGLAQKHHLSSPRPLPFITYATRSSEVDMVSILILEFKII